ncbi:amino acid/amide ABC transporter ATP-binding protein 2, HAAT family (TC 3.A.1.4.-) [Acetomicrobium thermoterrenum DSM 13490]|jgi:branched-chain amino acid transport system ATP-binding protein|uniref:Amino acid/amide ABC transporter ATP-binding protein 2, HAAT family (TC 3.A.1.4.-) n=1 Tax=Acetomicrobium thermoterrenum DSM 13490 TaxID=1120987 RepID=A0A1H3F1Q2_9BACT|nr:ABC transporter ATP-binding protein [Acetomicrobium thermoterrenum]SDX84973.1 amino acid/amide ABC transporter ATP-binding protein 2, HAAT family (TC 3.A.1.4.-) [Acetomicrobium thermoterrenum DSM 13490]
MLLNVQDIEIAYDRIKVLWGVTLCVGEGEIVSLLGANGAGKSTLLKGIMGIVPLQRGSISFLEKDVSKKHPWKKAKMGIAYIPEGGRVFPDLTVEENLMLIASLHKEAFDVKENLDLVYSLFPVLKERLQQKAGTLSGGERQMLAIGRALMSKPKLLLIDEVSMGLMPKLVSEVFNTLSLLKEYGISILLTEQNVPEALAISDRGYVLENGRITISGNSEELLGNEMVKMSFLGL